MSKTKKIISVVLTLALVMAMATVAMVSASAATTVYFEKPDSWDTACAYIWLDVDNNGWPGAPMTDCGNGLWSIEAEPGANIIFTNGVGGAGYQTADNVVPTDGNNCAYLNGETATNGYGEVFDAVGWKTVEVTPDETTEAAPAETTEATPVETTEAAPVETTEAAPVETTEAAPVETTAASVDETTVATEPVETTVATEPVETTVATEPVETTVATEPVETTAVPDKNGIVVAGKEYTANVGDEVTYTATLKTPNLIEDVQGYVTYDATKLTVVECNVPQLGDSAIVNTEEAGVVYFNASVVKGIDFTAEATLVEIKFTVNDTAYSEIALTIEEMTEKDGDSYFTDSEQKNDAVVVTETLTVPEIIPTTESTPAPTATETTPAPTATATNAGTNAPETDATGTTGGDTEDTDVVPTGATVAIYAVLATLAMAAAAVVVLRKKVNG